MFTSVFIFVHAKQLSDAENLKKMNHYVNGNAVSETTLENAKKDRTPGYHTFMDWVDGKYYYERWHVPTEKEKGKYKVAVCNFGTFYYGDGIYTILDDIYESKFAAEQAAIKIINEMPPHEGGNHRWKLVPQPAL